MSTIKEQLGDYLASEGLRAQEKDYGFSFRYEMKNFIIHWDEDDELFLAVIMPCIFEVDENNRNDVLEIANKISNTRKVVKCTLHDEEVWLQAEFLIDSDPGFGDIIPRSLNMLIQAQQLFYQELMEG